MNRRLVALLVVLGAVTTVGCSGDDDAGDSDSDTADDHSATTVAATPPPTSAPLDASPTVAPAPPTTAPTEPRPPESTPADAATIAEIQAAIDGAAEGCDPLDVRHCFLPYPSNHFTVPDPSTETGLRVAFTQAGAPVNASGVAIDMAEINRNDGFSPNSTIITFVEDLDPIASDLPAWADLGASLADDANVVLIDAESGERFPLWAEPDLHATDAADQALIIHPAVALPEGRTYVVALRNLVATDGTAIEPSAVFRAYRDRLLTDISEIEARRESIDADLAALEGAGIARDDVILAWDFTTASTGNIAGRMLHIRDTALDLLGDAAPAVTVTAVVDKPEEGIAYRVEGTYTVPNFLEGDGGPGNAFHYEVDPVSDPDALPSVNPEHPTLEAPFACNIAEATLTGDAAAHLVQYGHGLLGSHMEINAGNVRAFSNEHDIVHCATKWAGMSEDDIGNAVEVLGEFSSFDTMADRLQQGVLNQIFLGRLMLADDGLVSLPEFQRADGTPLIDNSELDYDGNSQGGIMGLMLIAVSPDIDRAVLGVPGMNYSLLLPRSVDFETYESVMEPAYPNQFDRTLIISLIQTLWDRGEGSGYVQHVTSDNHPDVDPVTVLLDVAYGDHQVSQLSALIEARTLGASIHRPVAADGRWAEVEPGWGLESIEYPWDGSAVIVWDSGMEPIPVGNVPPDVGDDSHEDPRADPDVRTQKAAFLFDDTLVDVCAGAACPADHRE